jgi:hypothetical protein
MRRILSLTVLAAALLVCVRPSAAQEPAAAPVVSGPRPATHGVGLGVGAEGMLLGGPAGMSVAYDAGPWHADGLLGLIKPGSGVRASFDIGGRFWYHLHSTSNADFSVGGGLGYLHQGHAGSSSDGVWIEAGAQIRAFIASNVALSGSLGLSIATIDFEAYGLTGQILSGQALPPGVGAGLGLGLHYYFY